jgi:hypothetical protein
MEQTLRIKQVVFTQLLSNPLHCIKPMFGSSILGMHSLECIIENAFSRMHFAENIAFDKILKLFIISDYAKRYCVWLVF